MHDLSIKLESYKCFQQNSKKKKNLVKMFLFYAKLNAKLQKILRTVKNSALVPLPEFNS